MPGIVAPVMAWLRRFPVQKIFQNSSPVWRKPSLRLRVPTVLQVGSNRVFLLLIAPELQLRADVSLVTPPATVAQRLAVEGFNNLTP